MKIRSIHLAYLTLLIHWGPSNALSYGWGFLLLLFVLIAKPEWLRVNGHYTKSIATFTIGFIIIFFLSAFINFAYGDSSLNNLGWSVFTYGSTIASLLVILFLPFREGDAIKLFRFNLVLTFIEVAVGYVQMLQAQSFQSLNPYSVLGPAAGDNFVGTTFDWGIGNLVAIKMSFMAILFIPFWMTERNLKNSILLIILLVGWILPSAIYTLLLGFISIAIFFVGQELARVASVSKMRTHIFFGLVAAILMGLIFVYTQQENVRYTVESLKQVYTTLRNKDIVQASRKMIYYRETLTELPAKFPRIFTVGIGPGNYSSRSAWLVSGDYLTVQPEYISVTPSDIAKRYTIKLWGRRLISDEFKGGGSITNQPFSTWLSVFAEMGLFGLIALILIFSSIYRALSKGQVLAESEFDKNLNYGLRIMVVYVVLLFFVDNIFEWPLVMAQLFVFVSVAISKTEQVQKRLAAANGQ
ncbi:MAG TPA: hypothetical protein PLX35_01550 [Cyclobacteriaceae bacterium]|nr:hypothetical protein [Cyclobacteriaceae bacterium]